MLKRINSFINIIMWSSIGVFLGHGLYVFWDYRTHSDLYAMQSAPWYTSIWVYGVFTLMVLAVCAAVKAVLKWIMKKRVVE